MIVPILNSCSLRIVEPYSTPPLGELLHTVGMRIVEPNATPQGEVLHTVGVRIVEPSDYDARYWIRRRK